MLVLEVVKILPAILFVTLLGFVLYSGIWNQSFNPKFIGFDYVKPVIFLGAIDTLLVILQTYLYFRIQSSNSNDVKVARLLYSLSFLAFLSTIGLLVAMFFAVNNREKETEKLTIYEIITLVIVYMTFLFRSMLVIGPYINKLLGAFLVFYLMTVLTLFFVLPATGTLRFDMAKFKPILLFAIPLVMVLGLVTFQPKARITATTITLLTMGLFADYLYLYATS